MPKTALEKTVMDNFLHIRSRICEPALLKIVFLAIESSMGTISTIISDTSPPLYALKLLSGGPNRLRLLFEIRTIRPDLSLIAAKAFLNHSPSIIQCELRRDDVEELKRRFEELAKVEIVLSDGRPLPQRLYETHPEKSRSGIIDG